MHEIAECAFQGGRELLQRLRTAVQNRDLPPAYYDNPVVRASAEPVMPWGLYLDALPYSICDAVVGVWLINLITKARHIVAVVRKRYCCKCGCRGWCTFYPTMAWLHYCFASMAEQVWPSERHDKQKWTSQDAHRASKAGQRYTCKGILLQLKLDWAELVERIGLPNWRSALRPCFLCSSSPDSLYRVRGVSLAGLPWHSNTYTDYDQACSRCEVWIEVDRAMVLRIRPHLRYDKRPDGALGRALAQGIPDLRLRENDRLEPSQSLPDVAAFDDLCSEQPHRRVRVCFWRRSQETLCLHRFPLWDEDLGITPGRVLCLDLLHTLYLGVMLNFCRLLLWKLLLSGRWGMTAGTGHEALIVAVMCLRHELFSWYTSRRRSHPQENLTELSDLVPNMFGSMADPQLKTKAAETYGVLVFLADNMDKYVESFGADARRYKEAAGLLLRYVEICKSHAANFPEAVLQDSFGKLTFAFLFCAVAPVLGVRP